MFFLFSNHQGKYDALASKLIMQTTLAGMKDDAVIYADSEELNGFAVFVPLGFTGSKTLPFLLNGGIELLLPVLEFCDDEKMVTYLETNKESNVGMYERFGFELKETNLIPTSPVKHYSMVREPK